MAKMDKAKTRIVEIPETERVKHGHWAHLLRTLPLGKALEITVPAGRTVGGVRNTLYTIAVRLGKKISTSTRTPGTLIVWERRD